MSCSVCICVFPVIAVSLLRPSTPESVLCLVLGIYVIIHLGLDGWASKVEPRRLNTYMRQDPLKQALSCKFGRKIYFELKLQVYSTFCGLLEVHSVFRYVVIGVNTSRCSRTQDEIIASKTELLGK